MPEANGVLKHALPGTTLLATRLTTDTVMRPARPRVSFVRTWVEGVESAVGLLCCMFLSLFLPAICLLGANGPGRGWNADRWLALAALVAAAAVEGYCIALVYGSFGHRRPAGVPFAPAVALKQRRLPLPLRPVAAAWWLGHFALGAGLAYGVSIADLEPHGTLGQRAAAHAFALAVAFGLAYAANVYLLLGVTALTGNEQAVWAVWRFRLLVDFSVAAAAAVAGTVVRAAG